MPTASVVAQGLVPPDFFNAPRDPSAPAGVEANTLVFDGATGLITANGDVVLKQSGYTVRGQGLVYDRRNGKVRFTGGVTVQDPSGNILETTDLELTEGLKQAFLDSLTITTYDGARITADSVDYDQALRTLLRQASYSPCGDCIDDQGRRIGWSVSAPNIIYNAEEGSLYLEQPSLAVLGIPVAWLPFLYLPDTSETALANVRMPSIDSGEKIGIKVEVPITAYSSRWSDIVLTPTLLTRQGFLMGAEWIQRFDNGSFQVKASGIYQLDKDAFTFVDAKRDWRGAIQTSGSFRPVEDWEAGWSYTAFTDAAYLPDYRLTMAKSSTNEVYTTHLTRDTYIDARLQEFNQLGDNIDQVRGQQGAALPTIRFNHYEDLADDTGRIEISGKLLGVRRQNDDARTYGTFGYAGGKQHASVQAGWQKQWIGAGGFVATPYLGGRADFAYYDGTSSGTDAPGQTSLWSATPIAAMDVRFPMSASDGSTVHLIEPIGQLVYRGSNTTAVGITNDDAQSFVFDDTNLFSYNRFSGSDRQETGLRANVGGRYQASFADGGYVEVVAGQSFQLAGNNAFAASDPSKTGLGSGMDVDASYAVLGLYGSLTPGIGFGGKLQLDPNDPQITRAGLGASFARDGYSATLDYDFIAANNQLGQFIDQHEIGAEIGVPLAEYWTVRASTYWDIANSEWLQFGGGLTYDDGFVAIGAGATRTGPTHTSPNDTRITATFRLKAPAGLDVGYSGAVPVPGL